MIVAVTNRALCPGAFEERIKALAQGKAARILLREKDLPPSQYEALAARCRELCASSGTTLVVNSRIEAAKRLGIGSVQVPFPVLLEHRNLCREFQEVAVSVHGIEEAVEAQARGATYLIAGHIFETGCKPGLPARGLSFLRAVCESVSIPVLAIGGIRLDRLPAVREAGAKGVCLMSELMTCDRPQERLAEYRQAWKRLL